MGDTVAQARVMARRAGSGGAAVACDGDDGATGFPANERTRNNVNAMRKHTGVY